MQISLSVYHFVITIFSQTHIHFAFDLIAPDVGKPDGGEHINLVDDPPQARVVVDGLHQPPRCGGGHHVIGDPFHLQLRAAEAGVSSPDLQPNHCIHSFLKLSFVPIIPQNGFLF